jgi:DHA2 family metal-tetracycline-proton antiporter-like MFS transporter
MQSPAANHGILQDPTQQKLLLVLVSVAGFMGALDSTIVNISLPTIATYFDTSVTIVSWVSMAYLLTLSATLIAFGRLADIRGYRKVYLAGFAVFTVGSFLCGMLSASIGELVGFRVLQAIGAAMLQAIGGAMITMYLPAESRGKALGIMTTFVSVGVAAGPVLGGFLTTYLSWNWIFLINVPVGIAAILIGIPVLPKDSVTSSSHRQQFDAAGAGILFAALGTLVFAINMGKTLGWTSPVIIGSILVSAISFAAFVFHERRSPAPLIDLAFFKNHNYTFANISALIAMLLVTGSSFILPFYLENAKGLPTDLAGLLLMVPAIALMVMGPVAGRLSDAIGSRRLCLLAAVCYIGAYLLYSQMTPSTSYLHIIAALILMGTAAGLFIPPNFRLILGYSPRGAEGVVSSLAMTVRNIGSVMAVAFYGTIFVMVGFAQGMDPQTKHLTVAAMDAGFNAVFLFGAGLGVLLLILTVAVREQKRDVPGEEAAMGMGGL